MGADQRSRVGGDARTHKKHGGAVMTACEGIPIRAVGASKLFATGGQSCGVQGRRGRRSGGHPSTAVWEGDVQPTPALGPGVLSLRDIGIQGEQDPAETGDGVVLERSDLPPAFVDLAPAPSPSHRCTTNFPIFHRTFEQRNADMRRFSPPTSFVPVPSSIVRSATLKKRNVANTNACAARHTPS